MAIYIKDAAIKDASLVNGKIVDGTIEQAKLKDPYYTKTEVDNKFTTLSATDTAVNGKYVSAVSETNGVISVTRKDLKANEIECTVSDDIFDFEDVDTGIKALAFKVNSLNTECVRDYDLTSKIESLDVNDVAVADKYVNSVSETDGKISVHRVNIPVKDVTLAGTSVVTANVAELATATPTETKYTTNADGTINTQSKLEVATSKANDLLIGADVATIKSYVDDKVDEKLIAAGSGEMNVLEGVKVGGTALAVTGKNVNIALNETKVTGDNGVKSITLDAGQIKTVYDKFVESAATSGVTNQYAFFSGNNEITGKTIADGYAVTTSGSNSAFNETAGTYTIPSTRAIYQYLDNVLGGIAGAMSFKGDCGNIATTTFNENSLGWTYVASAAGSYAGVICGVGDMMIVNGVTGGVASWTKVSATTTVENKGAEITTASTELAKVNGTSITASVAVTTPSTCELTTASTEIAKVAGKAINAQLKDSATAYTPGSVSGSGASQVVTYPTLVATNMTGVVTGADVKDISDFVVDYVTKSATAAGSGEMNKVDDVKVDGVSIVSAKVASIPNASTTAKGTVQLATTYLNTDATKALTGASIKAELDNTVHKTGEETINGDKTVNGMTFFKDNVHIERNLMMAFYTIQDVGTPVNDADAANKEYVDAKYTKPSTGIPESDLAQEVKDKLNTVTTIVDNLTSDSSTSALSAKQGKALDSKIGDLSTLTTTAKTSAVAAINEIKGNYVDLTTDQTIGGCKTFDDYLTLTSAADADEFIEIKSNSNADASLNTLSLLSSTGSVTLTGITNVTNDEDATNKKYVDDNYLPATTIAGGGKEVSKSVAFKQNVTIDDHYLYIGENNEYISLHADRDTTTNETTLVFHDDDADDSAYIDGVANISGLNGIVEFNDKDGNAVSATDRENLVTVLNKIIGKTGNSGSIDPVTGTITIGANSITPLTASAPMAWTTGTYTGTSVTGVCSAAHTYHTWDISANSTLTFPTTKTDGYMHYILIHNTGTSTVKVNWSGCIAPQEERSIYAGAYLEISYMIAGGKIILSSGTAMYTV